MARTVKGTLTIEGQEIQITNPDKPLWPEVGITKAMYLQKLAAISPFLLRYCRGRRSRPSGIRTEPKANPSIRKCAGAAPPFVQTYVHENINYVAQRTAGALWLGNLARLSFTLHCTSQAQSALRMDD